jgi:glycogen operon protein
VSYTDKHNTANGEDNRDGAAENYGENYGFEGPSRDPAIEAVRLRQIKNMLATLFVSRGVPMLLGGDEFRRSQLGNNNAYCQDNEVAWYDWGLLERNQELFRFTCELIAFRKRHEVLRAEEFYTDQDIRWFHHDGEAPSWDTSSRTLGCMILPRKGEENASGHALCLMFNAGPSATEFSLPKLSGRGNWYLVMDTSKAPPDDIRPPGKERSLDTRDRYLLEPHAIAILTVDSSEVFGINHPGVSEG